MTTTVPVEPVPQARSSSSPAAICAVVAVVLGCAVASLALAGPALERDTVVLAAALPVGLALSCLAVTRFEWFVLVVLAIRPSLDIAGADGLGPGAMLAGAFVALASIWLVVQRADGRLAPLSIATKALCGFLAATLVAVITSQLPGTSATAALEVAAGIVMFLVLEQLLDGRPDRARRLVAAVLASAVVPLMVALVQWVTGDVVGSRTDVGRIRSTFVHPNPFATYLVLVVLLGASVLTMLRGRQRWMLGVFLGLLGFALVLTYNRSGWIAVVVGLLYIGLRRSRWLIGALLVGAVVAVAAVPSVGERIADLGDKEDFAYLPDDIPENSFEWRMQYWESLVPMAGESPVTGVGPQVIVNTRVEALEPHNVFVQTYVETGLLGLSTLLVSIVAIGVVLARRRRAATTAAERALAVGAVAVALAVLVMAPSENLLNQTMSWWYLAACATWGFRTHARSAATVPQAIGVPA